MIFTNFQNRAWCEKYLKDNKQKVSIWRANMLEHLSMDIICSSKLSFSRAVYTLGKLFASCKYPSIFRLQNWVYCIYLTLEYHGTLILPLTNCRWLPVGLIIKKYAKHERLCLTTFFKHGKKTSRSIFDGLRGVWKCGQTRRSWKFDMSSRSKRKLRSKLRIKSWKYMLINIRYRNTSRSWSRSGLSKNFMNY